MPHLCIAPLRFSLTVLCFAGFAQPMDVSVSIQQDFTELFDVTKTENSSSASASQRQLAGREGRPGIFLHPHAQGDTVLRFKDVPIGQSRPADPASDPDGFKLATRYFLTFHIGIRDGIDWRTERASKPNGVRFTVHIRGEKVFEEDLAESRWHPRAIDLAPWSGQTVDIEFHTNAIDGNTNYDWAMFGHPLVVRIYPLPVDALPEGANGLVLAQVRCAEPSNIELSVGGHAVRASLGAGDYWLPVEYDKPGEGSLKVLSGSAELVTSLASFYEAKVRNIREELSTPLVTTGRPFSVAALVKNLGLGCMTETLGTGIRGGRYYVTSPVPAARLRYIDAFEKEADIPVLAPGKSAWLSFGGLQADKPGAWHVAGEDLHVFGPEPETPRERPEIASVNYENTGLVRAVVSNPWSRLIIVAEEDGQAYAIAETWNGDAWQRVASLYPLARLILRREGSSGSERKKEEVNLLLQDIRQHRFFQGEGDDRSFFDQLILTFGTGACNSRTKVELVIQPDPEGARIALETHCFGVANHEICLLSGPQVLAGDRASGAKKDFAIFPGLEYLEGNEDSSSERDLQYPLSDRRVPAHYKIATPLMATQAEDALVALLWDANQEWAPGQKHPAARFNAPKVETGFEHIHMSLFAPSVGEYVKENEYQADTPYVVSAQGDDAEPCMKLHSWLVLDHASNYPEESIVHGPHQGGLALQAFRHYFDVFGFPEPSPQPRPWKEEVKLCLDGYLDAVWEEEPPGWKHCYNWDPDLLVGHAVPHLLLARETDDQALAEEARRRVDLVVQRAIRKRGPHYLWSNAGCHILKGELPFYYGLVGESLADFNSRARNSFNGRENGLWVWRPRAEKYADLGIAGDHTLSQAAQPLMMAFRAARLTGDAELLKMSLDAMKQMEGHEVPRGAQTWECPLYQPDILAAAQAIRAYCEAYRMTGDATHLEHARYWAWTGLPFLYMWDMEGYPTMRYNVISVIGSTFYTHSWLGQPVVWCGLVYAYALQDLAEFDDSFDWRAVAQGINNSAMWQQYPDGPNRGTYPDSWYMADNRPCPADINPENIVVNEFRLRDGSPQIYFRRIEASGGDVVVNSTAQITSCEGTPGKGAMTIRLAACSLPFHTLIAPIPRPTTVEGTGEEATDGDALLKTDMGWCYHKGLRAIIVKSPAADSPVELTLKW